MMVIMFIIIIIIVTFLIKGLYSVSMVLLAIAMRERDERLIDRLIQKNLDGREGTAMRSRIETAPTPFLVILSVFSITISAYRDARWGY